MHAALRALDSNPSIQPEDSPTLPLAIVIPAPGAPPAEPLLPSRPDAGSPAGTSPWGRGTGVRSLRSSAGAR